MLASLITFLFFLAVLAALSRRDREAHESECELILFAPR
jgi:hypothetical protein